MTEEHEYSKNVTGGPGITAGGDVSIGDVSGSLEQENILSKSR